MGLEYIGPISLPGGELSKGGAGFFCHFCVFRAPHTNRAEKAVQSCIIKKLSVESLGRILGADTSRKDPGILWAEPGKLRRPLAGVRGWCGDPKALKIKCLDRI